MKEMEGKKQSDTIVEALPCGCKCYKAAGWVRCEEANQLLKIATKTQAFSNGWQNFHRHFRKSEIKTLMK